MVMVERKIRFLTEMPISSFAEFEVDGPAAVKPTMARMAQACMQLMLNTGFSPKQRVLGSAIRPPRRGDPPGIASKWNNCVLRRSANAVIRRSKTSETAHLNYSSSFGSTKSLILCIADSVLDNMTKHGSQRKHVLLFGRPPRVRPLVEVRHPLLGMAKQSCPPRCQVYSERRSMQLQRRHGHPGLGQVGVITRRFSGTIILVPLLTTTACRTPSSPAPL